MKELLYALALEKFLGLLPEKGAVLEVNPGQGRYSKVFAEKGYKVLAAETAPETAAPVPYAAETVQGELNALLLPYRSLVGIWAPKVLSELSRDEAAAALHHFSDWVHPSGIVLFTLLEGEGEKRLQPSMNSQKARRLVYYAPDEAAAMVEAAGLTVIDAWRELIQDQPSLQVLCRPA